MTHLEPQWGPEKRNLQRHNFLVCFPNPISSKSSLRFTLPLVQWVSRPGLLPRPLLNHLGHNPFSDTLLRTRNPSSVSWILTGQIVLVLSAILLRVCNCLVGMILSCQSATTLTVCNSLDSLQLSWQSYVEIGHGLCSFGPCFQIAPLTCS